MKILVILTILVMAMNTITFAEDAKPDSAAKGGEGEAQASGEATFCQDPRSTEEEDAAKVPAAPETDASKAKKD